MYLLIACRQLSMMRGLLLCLLLSGPLYGQTSIIDSLEKQLPNTHLHDTVRIEQLNVLAREYTYISASKATLYAQRALDLSRRTGYKRGQAYAYRNLASSYSAQEYFYSTTEFMEKAITIFEELADSVGMANLATTAGPGQTVALTVKDSGQGMTHRLWSRLYDEKMAP